jgi:hypothetical protein
LAPPVGDEPGARGVTSTTGFEFGVPSVIVGAGVPSEPAINALPAHSSMNTHATRGIKGRARIKSLRNSGGKRGGVPISRRRRDAGWIIRSTTQDLVPLTLRNGSRGAC